MPLRMFSIEKKLLLLLALSLLLHLLALFAVSRLPAPQHRRSEPMTVDLADLPPLPAPPPLQAPRRSAPAREARPTPHVPDREYSLGRKQGRGEAPPPVSSEVSRGAGEGGTVEEPKAPVREEVRGEGMFAAAKVDPSRLLPTARDLSRMENEYRRKYRDAAENAEADFFDRDDILLGSFNRRFENAVYGVWRYPGEAARQGIEGVTLVRITFNRLGEIDGIQILESSGSRLLDEEVLRTLRSIGPMGPLPRTYPKPVFNLLAFFHYGSYRGSSRSFIH